MKRKFKDNILFQPVKVENYLNLFSSLTKTVLNGFKGNFDEALLSSMEVIGDLGIENTEDQLSWKLINRSAIQAITDLVKENQSSFNIDDEGTFIKKIKELKYDKELKVDSAFFKAPKENAFVKDIQNILFDWFQLAGIDEYKSKAMTARFPSFFVYALNDEWAKNSKAYERLLAPMETPFSEQAIMEDDWEKYKAYLDKQTQESIFGEAFGLSQIYIPLCAYYKEKNKDDKEEKKVVNLHDIIPEWLNKDDKNDSVRIISGGPGSGKSSFVKIFAANIINTHRVLFIPLHRFSLNNDIEEDINKFLVRSKYFEKTPLGKEEKLIIIFDGLDEISMQGKIGVESANNFIGQVKRLLENYNHQIRRLSIIVTGRDLPVHEIEKDFKETGQVLHVLPYYVDENRPSGIIVKYFDDKNLLSEDKRNLWWKKYGQLTGKNYEEFPKELKPKISDEITTQPLLNYLVALSYDHDEIKFADNTKRSDLYRDLINAVYKRGWQGKHRALEYIEKDNFEKVLEEIAVSVWQGAGRTATVKDIEERCKKSEIDKFLPSFKKNAEDSVLNVLMAFYFHQFGETKEGYKTFEFTHKSFGEYLTARRIIGQLQKTKEKLELQKTERNGWTEETALINWIDLCGNAPLDAEIHNFLCDEISRNEQADVRSWQDMLCELISYMLKFCMPFEKIAPRPTYYEEIRLSRNAEEALLVALSICSWFTEKISNIKWENEKSAGEWFSKLCVKHPVPSIFRLCLNNLALSKCVFLVKDFAEANLKGADLSGADLNHANLTEANLNEANLSGADLSGADLNHANLTEANLEGAKWIRAYLFSADLSHADLLGTDLSGVNLKEAKLRGANLSRANLSGANLRGADLRGADLREANLSRTDLNGTDLNGTDLRRANLSGADLRTTINLFTAILEKTVFQKGDLNETDLQKAIAKGAIVR